MSKNRNGFTKSAGNLEWGLKARKREDHQCGHKARAKAEAVATGLDEIFSEYVDDEPPYDDDADVAELYAEIYLAQYDDDPNPYHGDYSEC